MYRIIDGRGSGKTSRLMLLAKENNGILVCSNPGAMRSKSHAYGLVGFDIASYYDLWNGELKGKNKPIYIDELEKFVKWLDNNIDGYSLTNED